MMELEPVGDHRHWSVEGLTLVFSELVVSEGETFLHKESEGVFSGVAASEAVSHLAHYAAHKNCFSRYLSSHC